MNGSDDKINEALIESELFQERRQFHRVQINDPIQLYYDSDSYDEVLGELSLQGVRVHSFFDYAIGSAVDIGVSRPDKSILRLKGIVTRCNMTPHSQRAYKDSAREFTCNQCKWRVYRCFAANGGLKVISVSAPANLEFGIPEDTSSPRCPTCHVDMNSIIPTSGYELGVFFGEITIEEVSVINDIIAANIDQVVDGGAHRCFAVKFARI